MASRAKGTGVNPSVKTRYSKYHPLNLLNPTIANTATIGDFKQASCRFINSSVQDGVALNPLSNRHLIPGSKSWVQLKGMLSCSDSDMPLGVNGKKPKGGYVRKVLPADGSKGKRGPLTLSREHRARNLSVSRWNPPQFSPNVPHLKPGMTEAEIDELIAYNNAHSTPSSRRQSPSRSLSKKKKSPSNSDEFLQSIMTKEEYEDFMKNYVEPIVINSTNNTPTNSSSSRLSPVRKTSPIIARPSPKATDDQGLFEQDLAEYERNTSGLYDFDQPTFTFY